MCLSGGSSYPQQETTQQVDAFDWINQQAGTQIRPGDNLQHIFPNPPWELQTPLVKSGAPQAAPAQVLQPPSPGTNQFQV